MSGLGGDTFMLVYRRSEGKVWAMNASGPAPAGATHGFFRDRGYKTMPLRGMLAVSVPGAVAAMETAISRWGSGRFALGRLLEPAIRCAAEGVPVARRIGQWIGENAAALSQYPSSSAIFLPGGRPLREGGLLVQCDLAESIRSIAAGGARVFYEGAIADRIGAYSRAHGGLLSAADFAGYAPEVYEPIHTTYRGATVYTTAPPSQGFLLLEMLNILDGLPPTRWGSADAVHLAVEAKKLAYADRLASMGDPRFVRNPLDVLLDSGYAAARRESIDPARAAVAPASGVQAEAVGDTTYFCVADGEGNLVSYITSLSSAFGCAEIVDGTGIMLNNRAGRGFTLEQGHPNCIAPGKRTMHTLMACLAMRDGAPWLVLGTPGGDAQPQWNLQVLQNVLEFGMGVQDAVEAPRWQSFPGTDPANLASAFEVRIEDGYPGETVAELRRRGHRLHAHEPFEGGGGSQIIAVDAARGIYTAGSDPRVDGCAIGL
jgi:gamma-glutamyltranspeptidase/glutathione hydrolase